MAVRIDQTATEFVNQINNDVAAAAQSGGSSGGGGSVSTLSRTIKMKTQGGALVTGDNSFGCNGFMEVYHTSGKYIGQIGASTAITTERNKFRQNCHTTLMLGIENCKVTSVTIDSEETLTIFCYDSNGGYISNVSLVSEIPTNACYVKFQVGKTSDYTSLRILEVAVSGKPTLHKNSVPKLMEYAPFRFETNMPIMKGNITENDTAKLTTYQGSNASVRYFDTGVVMLPPNYTIDGDPVPLIVCCHGTTLSQNEFFNKVKGNWFYIWEFFAKNGYAVADCSGTTDAYYNVGEGFGAPSYSAALSNLVGFLIENYNIKNDGVYISCKSAGGFMAAFLAETQPFKIRAAGLLAPALSPTISLANHASQQTEVANMEAEQLGIDYRFTASNFDAEAKASIITNIAKWRQTDGFFRNTDISDSEMATIVSAAHAAAGLNTKTDGLNIVLKDNGNEEILATKKRWVPCPLKIWISQGDATVFYDNSRVFVEMGQRAGSPCYLRTVPSATTTGQSHHAMVDTSTDAPRIQSYKTKYGGIATKIGTLPDGIPIAIAELVDWFNQW